MDLLCGSFITTQKKIDCRTFKNTTFRANLEENNNEQLSFLQQLLHKEHRWEVYGKTGGKQIYTKFSQSWIKTIINLTDTVKLQHPSRESCLRQWEKSHLRPQISVPLSIP